MSTEHDWKSWPAGYDRVILDETDSTNAEAIRRADSLTGPTWIMARNQTAARGRRGRVWANPRGNFSATLLLHPKEPPAMAALYSFVAALAAFTGLREVAHEGRYQLKWPNDVLLNGGKVAGILLESSGRADRLAFLAIGVGVNLAEAPPLETLESDAMRAVSVAGETGVSVSPETLLERIAVQFDIFARTLFQEVQFDPIRRIWLENAARLGKPIVARVGKEDIAGTFTDLDMDGNMILDTPGGIRTVAAADVYF